jgi:LmbE family N-acetylglucosaminyl deacetylase
MRRDFFPKFEKKRKKIMAIFPHPDDETCVATTLAYLSPLPNTVTVLLTLTRGGEGYWEKQKFARSEIKNVREKELRKAAKKLKIDKLTILDYPDTKLHEIDRKKLKKIILKHLKKEKPNLVLTYEGNSGITGHQDHILVSQATADAIKEIKDQWPIRLYWVVVPRKITKMIEGTIKEKLNPPEPEFCLSFFRLGFAGLKALQRRYLAFICHKSQSAMFRPKMGIPYWLANFLMHKDYFYWKKV